MNIRWLTIRRWVLAGLLALAIAYPSDCPSASQVQAQEVPQVKKLVDPTGGLPVDATADREAYRVIKLRPKAAEPRSKSRLFPDRSDLKPGNAAPIFLRQNFEAQTAMKQRNEFFKADPGPMEKLLSDTKILEVENLGLYRVAELERAAYRERAGWEYPLYEPEYEGGGNRILLPDVQEARICNLYLCELARASIAQGNTTKAERYIRMGLGLTHHLSETPFMVVMIVGSAHCGYYQFAIEELMQMPEAPNYYWDLAGLPRPIVDPRAALQWEWNILPQSYPELRNLDALATDGQWQALYDKILNGVIEMDDGRMPKADTPEFEQFKKDWAKKSRDMLPRLEDKSTKPIDSMSDSEASLRYWWVRAQQLQNTLFASGLLEPYHAIEHFMEREQKIAEMFAGEELILNSIMPFLSSSQFRFVYSKEQKFAMLRTIEAVRHWSAEHNGKLPESLSELKLPAPLDPLSGKPFEYQRAADGKSAELHGKSIALPKDTVKSGFSYRLELAD